MNKWNGYGANLLSSYYNNNMELPYEDKFVKYVEWDERHERWDDSISELSPKDIIILKSILEFKQYVYANLTNFVEYIAIKKNIPTTELSTIYRKGWKYAYDKAKLYGYPIKEYVEPTIPLLTSRRMDGYEHN